MFLLRRWKPGLPGLPLGFVYACVKGRRRYGRTVPGDFGGGAGVGTEGGAGRRERDPERFTRTQLVQPALTDAQKALRVKPPGAHLVHLELLQPVRAAKLWNAILGRVPPGDIERVFKSRASFLRSVIKILPSLPTNILKSYHLEEYVKG